MEATSGNTANLTPEASTLISKRMTVTKPTSKEEALAEAGEAEASMEAEEEALGEVHLENNTISRTTINTITRTSLTQMVHHLLSRQINTAMLCTATTVHHLPEEVGMATTTETRQLIASL